MSARTKFSCTGNLAVPNDSSNAEAGSTHSVSFSPVVTGSEENEQFFAATPSGALTLSVVNPEVASAFEVGKEYYLDITSAE